MAKANNEGFQPSNHEDFAKDWSPAEGSDDLKLERSFDITEGDESD